MIRKFAPRNVTHQMMVDEINRRNPEKEMPTGNSFSDRGRRTRWNQANALLRRLNNGGKPTTREVVGYFGKGARFAD